MGSSVICKQAPGSETGEFTGKCRQITARRFCMFLLHSYVEPRSAARGTTFCPPRSLPRARVSVSKSRACRSTLGSTSRQKGRARDPSYPSTRPPHRRSSRPARSPRPLDQPVGQVDRLPVSMLNPSVNIYRYRKNARLSREETDDPLDQR